MVDSSFPRTTNIEEVIMKEELEKMVKVIETKNQDENLDKTVEAIDLNGIFED